MKRISKHNNTSKMFEHQFQPLKRGALYGRCAAAVKNGYISLLSRPPDYRLESCNGIPTAVYLEKRYIFRVVGQIIAEQ